ncbi:protein late bloomer isoform X1 [Ceratitis capitata]|uniref:protein late bloomer isoform X1 n=1 Tax=Ceratitis capitata TaxID=7213 RepID=UPI000A1113C9|nr:protein late bloomer isoform X1 [Ceratitis capitata]
MNYLIILIKYLVVFFNFLCGVFAIATVIVCALGLTTVQTENKSICITLIIFGSIIFLVALMGCCGALAESLCCLWTYAIFLVLLIVADLVLLIGFMKDIDYEKQAKIDMDTAWQEYLHSNFRTMNNYQNALHCCGRYGPSDYEAAGLKIPNSCYKKHIIPEDLYVNGCLAALKKAYNETQSRLFTFEWVTFAVEVIALVCAITLAITFQYESSRYGSEVSNF